MFAQQAKQELLQTTRNFHSCKQEEGQSVSSYVFKLKRFIDNLERLGYPVTLGLAVSLILIGLRKEFDGFVQNYNMHNLGNTVNKLHAMLKLHEQTLTLSKNNAPALHAIRAGKVQKGHWKSLKDDLEIDEPQSDIIPIRRSTRTRRPTDRMCLYIDAEEDELGDLGEPSNNKAALHDGSCNTTIKLVMWRRAILKTTGLIIRKHLIPVADIRAIRILIAIAAFYDYEIWQMDVKIAFFNGYLFEEVYMEQPA
ncbi:zinc finger, CCHC-type containing protein, partial [Tanacetum coccineum]